jgi:hypothetical protein
MIQAPLMDSTFSLPQVKTSQQLGALGERIVLESLAKAGYQARPGERKRGEHFDVWAKHLQTGEILCLEVKMARPAKDRKYRFTLWKAGCTDHRHSDYVILLALTHSAFLSAFVVPTIILANQHQAVITSHPLKYAGKLAQYRQSLSRLEFVQ